MRRNRITALGAVSLAIMIRDYPVASDPSLDPTSAATATALSGFLSPMPPPTNGQFEPYNSITARQPYLNDAPSSTASDSVDSIASAVSAEPSKSSHPSSADAKSLVAAQLERKTWQNSEARTKLKRQIDELPRTGSLLTLDVKDNDIRVRPSRLRAGLTLDRAGWCTSRRSSSATARSRCSTSARTRSTSRGCSRSRRHWYVLLPCLSTRAIADPSRNSTRRSRRST